MNAHRGLAGTAVLLVTLWASLAHAATITIGSTRDNTIYQATSLMRSNGAGTAMFAGRTNESANYSRRALVHFDVAVAVPAGSVIQSATLALHSVACSGSGDRAVSVHRVLKNWGEDFSVAPGNQEYGEYSADGDATWLHSFYYSPVPWDNPGGDFDPAESTTRIVPSPGAFTWPSTARLVADIQSFVDNPTSNHGWLLRGNETLGGTLTRFSTREDPVATWRPTLTITFVPEPSTLLGLLVAGAQILTNTRRR